MTFTVNGTGAEVPAPGPDPFDTEMRRRDQAPRLALVGVSLVYVLIALGGIADQDPGPIETAFVAAGSVIAFGLLTSLFLTRRARPPDRRVPWVRLTALLVVTPALALTGGTGFVLLLAMTASAFAAWLPQRPAIAAVAGVTALTGLTAWLGGAGLVGSAAYMLVPPAIAGFAFNGRRRSELTRQLRATRHELARMAVADERLRISRDLHDVLGHSLSLIAVKAQLARRLLPDDSDRAERELADIESSARCALGEVRHTITGYRHPTLAAELVSAQRGVASAGMACQVEAPETWELPADNDALLAWVVREGTTNVLRHSQATHVTLRLRVDPDETSVEITDDGVGLSVEADGRSGTGLVGLSERVGRAGGRLDTDTAEGGFRLRATVPVPVSAAS